MDHNLHKGITYKLATERGIATARLPITDVSIDRYQRTTHSTFQHIHLASRQVLTIFHVFEILCHFNKHHDWKLAFTTIIPERKGINTVKRVGEAEAHADSDPDADDVDVEGEGSEGSESSNDDADDGEAADE